MRAHRAIVAGKVPVDIEAWLFAIVRNRCHDYFRAAKPTAPLPPELPGGAPSAFEVVEQGERLAGALSAVERLPRAQRTALVGRELEGRSYEELARRQATTVPAVKSLLHRARATLAHQASLPAFVTPLVARVARMRPGQIVDGHGRRARDRRRGHRDHRAGGHERPRLAARSVGPPAGADRPRSRRPRSSRLRTSRGRQRRPCAAKHPRGGCSTQDAEYSHCTPAAPSFAVAPPRRRRRAGGEYGP